jgi:parallel beta-helix repeat protein
MWAQTTNWYVNDNSTAGDVYTSAVGNDANPGTAAAPFATLGKALTVAAASGDIIYMDAGSFTSATVSKSVTILGTNAGIHPAIGTHPTASVGTWVAETILNGLVPSADNITVDGIHFLKAGTRMIDTYANANNFTLRNCIVESTAYGATTGVIQFDGGSHTDCLFEFNLFTDLGDHTFYAGGGPYTNLEFQYNKFQSGGDAIFWAATQLSGGVIDHNEFDGELGINFNTLNIGQAGNLQLSGNWFHDNLYTAVQCGIINGSISGNTFETTYPYLTYGANNIELWGGQWGTAVSTNVNIYDNIIYYNDIPGASYPSHGLRLRAPETGTGIDGATIHVYDNKFLSGGVRTDAYAIRHQGDQTTYVDAEENYWGTVIPSQVAALFITPVDYSPYCNADLTYCGYTIPVTVVYVDDSWAGTSNGVVIEAGKTYGYNAFATILDGINAVEAGGTVNVAAGTYAGENIIDKSLTLLGDPGDINPGPGTNAPVVDGGSAPGDAFLIENGVTNVTIKGFEMRNFTSPLMNGIGNGISAWVGSTSYITIQDNYFHDLGYNGILVGNDYSSNPANWGDHTNWLVKKNIVSNCGYIGFELTNTSNSSIEDNVIHLNTPYIGAIFSSARRSETNLTVQNNLIDGTPSTSYPVIYVYAYDLDMPNPNLNNVLIYNNTISTAGTPYQVYINNIGTGTVTGVTVDHNSFSPTSAKALKNLTSAAIDAEDNYWGTVTPSAVGSRISGNVDYDPWCNADFSVCGFTTTSNIYNVDQGTYFTDLQDAINAAAIGDEIQVTGTHNDHSIIVNKGLKIAAGSGGAHFNGLGSRAGTLFLVEDPGAIIQGITIENYDYGVDVIDDGTATVFNCKFINNTIAVRNQNTATVVMAENNWWGAANGPLDVLDDRSTGGLYNPYGTGDDVSNYVDYHPWYVSANLTDQAVDIAVYNPECAKLEVKVKPNTAIISTTTPYAYHLADIHFAIRWDKTAYPGIFINATTSYQIYQQGNCFDEGNYRYAVFGYVGDQEVTWPAGTEQTILTVYLEESGAKFATTDFVIAQDAWALNHNANYYIQFDYNDFTGLDYHDAQSVYVGSCDLELDAKVLLQGPYDAATDEMKTDVKTMATFPLLQPYNTVPWNYSGLEAITTTQQANDPIADWVLIEARATASGPALERKAALLYKDGTIKDNNGSNLVRFSTLMPNNSYYFVVYHRNHMPVMTATAVNVPNASTFDLTALANAYTGGSSENALITLETGKYGMIAGDIYGHNYTTEWKYDGRLKYSGDYNDRGPILDKIATYNLSPYINGVINNEYYFEDLTMNKQVRYSGALNDPRLIILNLIELKNSYALNVVYESKVPGWVQTSPKAGALTNPGPLDIALVDTPQELLVNIRTNEALYDALTDNIQFTLCWDETSLNMGNLIGSYSGDFKLEPQGEPVTFNGKVYQVFAMVDAVNLPDPFVPGQEVSVLKFYKDASTGDVSVKVSIARDYWTEANNGDYYMSLWGVNRTGDILNNSLGIGNPGSLGTLGVYPNPASQGWVRVTLVPVAGETLTLTLCDLSGRTVREKSWTVTAGDAQTFTLSLEGLAKGTYTLCVTGREAQAREKIIVQ